MDLDALLNLHGFTQASLARALGVHRVTVNAWITRGRIPAERLADVVEALGLDADTARLLYTANGVALPNVLGAA